jgi:RNA polymerase sigma factor (sigma-70 family)
MRGHDQGSHEARDEADRRLLAAGNHSALVEGYYGHIMRRCTALTRNEHDAVAVAAEVAIRLLEELKRGRTYSVPYRVVVNKVIDWKAKEHYRPGKMTEVELGDHDLPTVDPYAEFESDYDLANALTGLSGREYEVAALRFREGLEPAEIAVRLGIDRNAVDQAWHRAKQKLRERIAA